MPEYPKTLLDVLHSQFEVASTQWVKCRDEAETGDYTAIWNREAAMDYVNYLLDLAVSEGLI